MAAALTHMRMIIKVTSSPLTHDRPSPVITSSAGGERMAGLGRPHPKKQPAVMTGLGLSQKETIHN